MNHYLYKYDEFSSMINYFDDKFFVFKNFPFK